MNFYHASSRHYQATTSWWPNHKPVISIGLPLENLENVLWLLNSLKYQLRLESCSGEAGSERLVAELPPPSTPQILVPGDRDLEAENVADSEENIEYDSYQDEGL